MEEDDEDDFFAYQTAKSLNNKRIQLKQYYQAPILSKVSSSSNDSNSESDNEVISTKKSKGGISIPIRTESTIVESAPMKSKDTIQNEIDAIVTSCFTTANKEVKRKIKLGKRTAADDQEYDDEDEYVTQLTQQQQHHRHRHHRRNGQINKTTMNLLDKSQLEEEEEKVTRETAAYNRLDAILRVTKPLCEKQIDTIENENSNDEENEPIRRDRNDENDRRTSLLSENVTLKIDHADGRQLTLILPIKTTLKDLYHQVSQRLSLTSIYLVHHNQTLKLDDQNQFSTLKQLNFSSDTLQFLESYPLIRKMKIFIQTSNSSSSSNRRSSFQSKREYTMMDTDRFETIFEIYKRDMKCNNIRFEFDGDTLHPQATPSDYDMIDGEILDAFILTTTK